MPPNEAADDLLKAAIDIQVNGAVEFQDQKLTVERPSTRQREVRHSSHFRMLMDRIGPSMRHCWQLWYISLLKLS